jgi:uncharacterized protein YbjT (DUF2867 family)
MFAVAGVTGHVGSVVARDLLSKSSAVKVLVRNAEKGAAWSKRGAEVAVGSLDDPEFLAGALKGVSGFFTLLPPNYQSTDFFATQKKTADSIATAVKTSGVGHVVMLSSIGANHPSGTGPIRGLYYLENALRATGTRLSAIRAGSFQENVGMSVSPAKQMGIFPNFAASADFPLPLIATKDIAALAVRLLLDAPAKSENIDLVGPAYTNRQVAEKLGAALGKSLQVVDIPPNGVVDAMMKGGMSKPLAELFAEMYDAGNKGLLVPAGDRLIHGTTSLDETIKEVLSAV